MKGGRHVVCERQGNIEPASRHHRLQYRGRLAGDRHLVEVLSDYADDKRHDASDAADYSDNGASLISNAPTPFVSILA